MRDSYIGGICDPKRATTCKKENCFYVTGNNNDCMHTTNINWIKGIENAKSKQGRA